MKKLAMLLLAGLLFNCTRQAPTTPSDNAFAKHYKPGIGEIMSGIQTHHAKLWFAGINENWRLSEYEINEITEMFQMAKEFETDRPEINSIPMIDNSLDSLSKAINQKNIEEFRITFRSMTNTCNRCHRAVGFEFNVITIPTAPPVTNQEFKGK